MLWRERLKIIGRSAFHGFSPSFGLHHGRSHRYMHILGQCPEREGLVECPSECWQRPSQIPGGAAPGRRVKR
jgi:hypothetical protein